jgi:uncharacterized protein (TIGR03067 family)
MRCCCLLLFVLALGFAPAPLPRRATPGPADELLGTWMRDDDRLVFTPGRLTVNDANGEVRVYDLTRDASARPATFALRGVGHVTGRDFRGVYRREGDVLRFTYSSATSPRPAEIGQGQFNEVLKRVR